MLKIAIIIFNHPLNKKSRIRALFRFLLWQLVSRIFKYPILLPFTDKTNYLCWKGLTGLTGNWYFGLMEMKEMSFVVHFLRPEDCFFDIGANCGAYTILASQHTMCEVHSFEPHPTTFKYLEKNIRLQENNKKISLHNLALGDQTGNIQFTADKDTINHIATENDQNVINVKINLINNLNITIPTIIKIDVEGFEMQVLKGASQILNNKKLKAIIIELNGSGLRYNITDKDIDQFLRQLNFEPYTYDPFSHKLLKLETYLSHNTIYIRDYDYCDERCSKGDSFQLANGVLL